MSYQRRLFCLSFILLVLTGCDEERPTLNGYVEGQYTYIAPTSSGILKELYVKRGTSISKGDKLFEIDDTELKVTVEKIKASILESEAIVSEDSNAYNRAQKLFIDEKVISKSELEKKESRYLVSQTRLEAAKQNLREAEKKIAESRPISEKDGYVEDTFFLPGEFVPTGKPVVSIFSYKDVKVRFFVPQKDIPKIRLEQIVYISCDGCKKAIKANITYIAKKAEYTPPIIYSKDSREKMVFLVEAMPETEEHCLHPGLPVDVDIRH